jgi:hypothetical protein
MDNPPPNPQASGPEGANWLSNIQSAITSSTSFLRIAAKEWIPFLLDQPARPPFDHDAQFGDESGRIARLLTITIIIYFVLIGSLRIAVLEVQTTRTIKTSLGVLVICILIALAYQPIAYICGVRIYSQQGVSPKTLSLRQIAFTVFYIFIPWVPILAFIRTSFLITDDPVQFMLLVAHLLCLIYVIYNFLKAIRLITNCYWYRIWGSMLMLLITVTSLIILSRRL